MCEYCVCVSNLCLVTILHFIGLVSYPVWGGKKNNFLSSYNSAFHCLSQLACLRRTKEQFSELSPASRSLLFLPLLFHLTSKVLLLI